MGEIDTREHLIRTAERLFAEHGIGAVSLRRINQAAGQKNASALHYHFGSREALIDAIFAYRMTGVNRRRLALLDAIAPQGAANAPAGGAARDARLRPVVESIVLPLAEQIDDGTGGSHYIRFLAQAYSDPAIDVAAIIGGKYDAGLQRANRMLRDILTGALPAEIVDRRLRLMAANTVYSLADRERQISAVATARDGANLPLFVADLVDSMVGALSAPVSATTAAQLAESRRRSA